MTRPAVLISEPIDRECSAWLGERCDIVEATPGSPEFDGAITQVDALVIRTYTTVDEALLARATRLCVIGRAGVGLDNVDLDACAARRVKVCHTPDANTSAVVELTLAFMLDAIRPRPRLEGAMEIEDWKSHRDAQIAPRQLQGATVGILGMGRIGRRLARALQALDARVRYRDLLTIAESDRVGATPVGFDELLHTSEILSVHVDGRASNRDLIGAREFALMRKDVVFINTSRGFVVQADALAGFLKANPDARAYLDVHEPEPVPATHPLLGLDNAVLTPHIAAATALAKKNMSWVVRDVWECLTEAGRCAERAEAGGARE